MYFGPFECHHRHGKSFAFDANGNAFRSDDLLHGRQRKLDFYGRECLSLEPRRKYSANFERDRKRFLYRPSDRRQWLFGDLRSDGGDGQSIACDTCDHGIRTDDLLRWRKCHLE